MISEYCPPCTCDVFLPSKTIVTGEPDLCRRCGRPFTGSMVVRDEVTAGHNPLAEPRMNRHDRRAYAARRRHHERRHA